MKTKRHSRRRDRFKAVARGDFDVGRFGRIDAPLSRPSAIERKRTRVKLRCGVVDDA